MSIAALLQAAEYLERREREAEHGYASSLPMPSSMENDYNSHFGGSPTPSSASSTNNATSRPIKIKKNQGSRSTHNELEKNRRAQLRTCLEKLKDLVPLGPESARHTTLGLLTRAKHFIKTLEERDRRHLQHKDQLNREQRFLRRKLEQLIDGSPSSSTSSSSSSQMNKRRANSLSECSTSTNGSSASSLTSSVSSETGIAAFYDEVDVIGYGSHGSDLDDQLSVQSASSDSGIGLGNVASIGHFPHLSITDSV